ncbi:MAG: hypothetical protein IMZ53_08175 [Thermoplasmata archaeon]|nr:hypothetical protein [Thermoplasmata archaeon]
MKDIKKNLRTGGICGLAGVAIFFGIAVLLEQFYWGKLPTDTVQDYLSVLGTPPHPRIVMGSHFLIGLGFLFFIVAFLSLVELLEIEKTRFLARTGGLLGIIACPIMVIEMIVQGTVMVNLGRLYVTASGETERQSLIVLYRGLRNIDLGIDLAFDFFFFSAWILLGFAMLKSRYFGKVFGITGVVLFGVAAVLNVGAAPQPPSFETAPIACLWILAVYVQLLRQGRSSIILSSRENPSWPGAVS